MTLRGPLVVGVVLALVGAALGLMAGQARAPLSESVVIEAAAARYSRETGRPREDCAARPSVRSEFWLIVTCAAPGGMMRIYPVDRRGRVLEGQDLS